MDLTKGAKWIPQDTATILFSAEKAAEESGCQLSITDINSLGFVRELKERLSGRTLPRIVIGTRVITGLITKQEIIRIHKEVCK
ncbi:MAG: hypothetical protein R6V83_06540 [Candidatus Thorarchaeota archaeon]